MTGRHNRIERTSMSPIFPAHMPDSSLVQLSFRRDRIVALVEILPALNKVLARALPPGERSWLEAACEEADREIDRIVYALYELTAEEIAVVEGVI